MTKPTWAIYVRVSTRKQANEGFSLKDQRETLVAYADQRGWDWQLFDDPGISGEKLDDRPGLIELLGAVENGNIEGVLVVDESRLARDEFIAATIRNRLKRAGVKIASPGRGEFDLSDPSDNFTANVLAAAHALEQDMRTAKMEAGLRQTAINGFWPGSPAPYGYKIIPADDGTNHSHLAIRDDEADVFHLVADLIVNRGMSTYKAATYLNAEGIKTRAGSRWTGTNLCGHLRKTHLTGTWTYDKTGDPIEMEIPALFTVEKWDELQAAIKGRPRVQQRHRSYALTGRGGKGHLRCSCGGNFYGKTDSAKTFSAYVCSGNPQEFGKHRCPHQPRSIRTERIEQAVIDELRPALSREYLLDLADSYLTQQEDDGDDVKRHQQIERRISELNRDKTRLARKLAQNDELDFLEDAMNDIVTEVAALLEQRNELDQRLQLRLRHTTVENQLQDLADVAQQKLDNLTTEELADVVDLFRLDLVRVGDHKYVGTASIPIPENGGEVWTEVPRDLSPRPR